MKRRNRTSETATANASSPTANSRAARKRATDRRAQREHRERQKAYVKQLEEKVELLSSDRTTDERVARLLREQTRLKELCARLGTRLDRIRNITNEERPSATESAGESPVNSEIYPPSSNDGSCQDLNGKDPTELGLGSEWNDVSLDDLFSVNHEYYADKLPLAGNGVDKPTIASLENLAEIDNWHQFATESQFINGTEYQQACQVTNNGCFDSSHPDEHHDSLNFEKSPAEVIVANTDDSGPAVGQISLLSPPSTYNWSLMKHSAQGDMGLESSDKEENGHKEEQRKYEVRIPPHVQEATLHEWLSLPNYQSPCTYRESIYNDMIQEARREHKADRFDASQVTLSRLLSKEPVDVLSFRLYHYMLTWGPIPMHLFLAVFWVHYLYLRWHVLLSQESYYQIPEFLRPKQIDRLVPHRLVINLLVWPDLRSVLIRDSDRLDPDAVSIELMTRINPNWSAVELTGCYTRPPTNDPKSNLGKIKSVTDPKQEIRSESPNSDFGIGPITDLDLVGVIEKQANMFAFWKVERSFVNNNPCFMGCSLG